MRPTDTDGAKQERERRTGEAGPDGHRQGWPLKTTHFAVAPLTGPQAPQ